jgi:hypothetical protein
MRLFSSDRDDGSIEAGDVINLLWRYEVSEDGGKTWYPEIEREDENRYVLRRGNWVAPALN